MPQADIEINAVASSNEDLPINTLVQFSNNDVGDESTYAWSIISQPPGAADAFSSLIIENPTLTPLKEDTYLVQLIVDQGLAGESVDRKLFRVRRLKTDAALIAVSETTQGTQNAWAYPQNETLGKILNRIYDGIIIVAQASEPLTVGATVELSATTIIKSGLPGAERVPNASNINATDPNVVSKIVGIAVGQPNGSTSVTTNDMVLVRMEGLFDVAHTGTPAVGDFVFMNDSGVLSLTPGTNRRQLGVVIDATPGAWRAFLTTLTHEHSTHALGGPLHTSATLAELNALVSDANMDDSGDGRIPLDYQSEIEVTRDTTSSTGLVTKIVMTTPALTGTYRVSWSCAVDMDTDTQIVGVQLSNITDGGTVGTARTRRLRNPGDRQTESSIGLVVFTGGVKQFRLQWLSGSAVAVAGISDAVIELWRVA